MGENEILRALWQYLDLSGKNRLTHKYTKLDGDHSTRYEFFEFLANKYDDSQLEFESADTEPIEEEAEASA